METLAGILTIVIILGSWFAIHHVLKGESEIMKKLEEARQQRRALAEELAKQDPHRHSRPV